MINFCYDVCEGIVHLVSISNRNLEHMFEGNHPLIYIYIYIYLFIYLFIYLSSLSLSVLGVCFLNFSMQPRLYSCSNDAKPLRTCRRAASGVGSWATFLFC